MYELVMMGWGGRVLTAQEREVMRLAALLLVGRRERGLTKKRRLLFTHELLDGSIGIKKEAASLGAFSGVLFRAELDAEGDAGEAYAEFIVPTRALDAFVGEGEYFTATSLSPGRSEIKTERVGAMKHPLLHERH